MPLITMADIEELKNHLDREFMAEFEQYLHSRSPWKKHQRRLSVTPYEAMASLKPGGDHNPTCIFTQDVPDKPVSLNGNVYNYPELRQWYINEGTDPVQGSKMS